MSEQYHRLFLRWEVVRGWIPALIFAGICVGLELLFFYNALNTGFVDKTVSIPIGSWNLPISIALSLALGNALVVVTLWMNVVASIQSLKSSTDSFYNWAFGVSLIDGATRFIISQMVAALGALVIAGLQLGRVKGTKNLVRAFQRRK